MAVRAKFKVTAKTELEGAAREVKLAPVTTGQPEDNLFGKLTPSGEIRMLIVNPPAAEQFYVGKAYQRRRKTPAFRRGDIRRAA